MSIDVKGNIVSSTKITNTGVFKSTIVRDGLTCYLDSNNKDSYPGSGTVWYDLSGNGNNGTMYYMNSPSAGNTSGFDTTTGYMMFDRHLGASDGTANNFVRVPNSTSLADCICQNGMSMEMWIKETSYVCTAITKCSGSWEIYYCSGLVFRTEGTGGNDGGTSAATSPGTWRQIVVTHNGTNRRVYINGLPVLNDINIVSGQSTTSNVAIGAYDGGVYSCIASIPIYLLYNRELNPYEIAQNFQAQRGRVGL